MRPTTVLFILLIVLAPSFAMPSAPRYCLASPTTEDSLARVTADLPFPMRSIELPVIPALKLNIIDFGAVGDGKTLNTAAFANAIEACAKRGGGRVVVPQGIWLTGPIPAQLSSATA